jgi:SAM-dependent methyltransferase
VSKPSAPISLALGSIYDQEYFRSWNEIRGDAKPLYTALLNRILFETGNSAEDIPTLQALDIASGEGFGGELLRLSGIENIVCVDIDFQAIKRGARTSPNLGHICGDAMQLPFADNTFDVVLDSSGISSTSEILKSASEIYRVLKPNSGTYISVETTGRTLSSHSADLDKFNPTLIVDGKAVSAEEYGLVKVVIPSESNPLDSVQGVLVNGAVYNETLLHELKLFGALDMNDVAQLMQDKEMDSLTTPCALRAASAAFGRSGISGLTLPAMPQLLAKNQILQDCGFTTALTDPLGVSAVTGSGYLRIHRYGVDYYAGQMHIDDFGTERLDDISTVPVPIAITSATMRPLIAKKIL